MGKKYLNDSLTPELDTWSSCSPKDFECLRRGGYLGASGVSSFTSRQQEECDSQGEQQDHQTDVNGKRGYEQQEGEDTCKETEIQGLCPMLGVDHN